MLDPTTTSKPRSILLIDDDEISRELMTALLGMSGYIVQCAASGEEAVQMLATGIGAIFFIFLDAQMPGLSGLPLVATLRHLSAARICLISASEPTSALRTAADFFLRKPFAPVDLDKMLASPTAEPSAHAIALPLDEPAPVVSPETVTQLRQMMPESALREIFAALVADLHKRIHTLESALAQGDAAACRRIGHAIKGGCSMAGAAQAARLGARIESGALDLGPVPPLDFKMDHNASVLSDLRLAIGNLERMLVEGFPD